MRKIKEVIKEYKETYRQVVGKEPDVMQKGSWIVINGKAMRSKEVEEATAMYRKKKPETLVDALIDLESKKVKPTLKPLKEYDIYKPEVKATATEILSSYDDVGMLAKAIHMKANNIRHTSKLSDARKEGHDIVKLAKKIMNIQGV